MRAKLLFALAGALLGAGAVLALRPRGNGSAVVTPGTAYADTLPGDALLAKPIAELDLDGVAFHDAIECLHEITGVPITVDWPAVEATGVVTRDAPVTVSARDVSLGEALTKVVDGTAPDPGVLDYVPDDTRIVVSSRASLASRRIVRCYDVRDLVAPDEATTQELADALMYGVEFVSPPSPGGGGAACYFDGRFIVTHSWRGHVDVRRLLSELRAPELNAPEPSDMTYIAVREWDGKAHRWTNPVKDDAAAEALARTAADDSPIEEVPFDEAVRLLGERFGVAVTVDWPTYESVVAFDERAVHRKYPVTVDLKGLTLQQALERVLAFDGVAAARDDYVFAGGGILIAPGGRHKDVRRRVYDVRKLLRAEPTTPARPEGLFTGSPREQAVEELIRLVTEHAEPETWLDNGGPVGSIREWRGRLIVDHTVANHRRIEALLDQLLAGERSPEHSPAGATTAPASPNG